MEKEIKVLDCRVFSFIGWDGDDYFSPKEPNYDKGTKEYATISVTDKEVVYNGYNRSATIEIEEGMTNEELIELLNDEIDKEDGLEDEDDCESDWIEYEFVGYNVKLLNK